MKLILESVARPLHTILLTEPVKDAKQHWWHFCLFLSGYYYLVWIRLIYFPFYFLKCIIYLLGKLFIWTFLFVFWGCLSSWSLHQDHYGRCWIRFVLYEKNWDSIFSLLLLLLPFIYSQSKPNIFTIFFRARNTRIDIIKKIRFCTLVSNWC